MQGVKLTRQLMGEAGRALKQNITTLGPLILPFSEQLIFGVNLVCRKFLQMKMKAYIPDFRMAFDHICIHTGGRAVIEEIEKQLKLTAKHVNPSKDTLFRYGNTSSSSIWCAPFSCCSHTLCIAPGHTVLLNVQSCGTFVLFAVCHCGGGRDSVRAAAECAEGCEHLRHGGSGCRYILSNIETKKGVKRGDRVWQIGFGSGFKCNSAVWRAMRNNNEQHAAWVEGVEMEHDPRWIDEYEAINVTNARLNAEEKAQLSAAR